MSKKSEELDRTISMHIKALERDLVPPEPGDPVRVLYKYDRVADDALGSLADSLRRTDPQYGHGDASERSEMAAALCSRTLPILVEAAGKWPLSVQEGRIQVPILLYTEQVAEMISRLDSAEAKDALAAQTDTLIALLDKCGRESHHETRYLVGILAYTANPDVLDHILAVPFNMKDDLSLPFAIACALEHLAQKLDPEVHQAELGKISEFSNALRKRIPRRPCVTQETYANAISATLDKIDARITAILPSTGTPASMQTLKGPGASRGKRTQTAPG